MSTHISIRFTLFLLLGLLIIPFAASRVSSQECGDADCDGTMTISDLSAAVDYFYVSYTPPPCPRAYEFDHHLGLNISDRLEFTPCFWEIQTGHFCGDCSTIGPPLVPQLSSENLVSVEPSVFPAQFSGSLTVSLIIKVEAGLQALQLPFRVLIGTEEAHVVSGSVSTFKPPSFTLLPTMEANNVVAPLGVGFAPAGRYKILQFQITAPFPSNPDPLPITMELVTYPRDSAYYPLLVYGERPQRIYLTPTITAYIPCCVSRSGNVDCDPEEKTDISDLTALIDHLYISFSPLCCKEEANCDGSLDGNLDIGDLTALIDYLYISFTPTAACL